MRLHGDDPLGVRPLGRALAGDELLWILAGLVYFAPAGTDPFKRVVLAAAQHLDFVEFLPTGNEIRERWVEA